MCRWPDPRGLGWPFEPLGSYPKARPARRATLPHAHQELRRDAAVESVPVHGLNTCSHPIVADPQLLAGADGDGGFSSEVDAELHPTIRTTKAASAATSALPARLCMTSPRRPFDGAAICRGEKQTEGNPPRVSRLKGKPPARMARG